jgi:hypothetical protein
MGFTKEQSETLRKLAAAKDVYEFVAVLDVSFPIWPGHLDLAKFVKYKTNSLKVSFEKGSEVIPLLFQAFGFKKGDIQMLMQWFRLLDQYRNVSTVTGYFNLLSISQKQQPTGHSAPAKLNADTPRLNSTEDFIEDEIDALIANLPEPTKEEKKRANGENFSILSAVYCGNDELLQSILTKNPKLVNYKNRENWTPLHYVMCIGCSDAATVLVNAGADAAAKTKDGVSAFTLGARLVIWHFGLIVLLRWGHRATVWNVCSVLVSKTSSDYVKRLLNTPDLKGRIPLHYAAESKQHVVCDVLCNFKANPNHQDSKGRSPVFFACETGNLDTIKKLLNHVSSSSI